MYDLNSDEELNGDFRTADHDNDSGNDKEEHTPREKGRPINKNNKNNKNKPSSPTVKETFLKATHNKETNE